MCVPVIKQGEPESLFLPLFTLFEGGSQPSSGFSPSQSCLEVVFLHLKISNCLRQALPTCRPQAAWPPFINVIMKTFQMEKALLPVHMNYILYIVCGPGQFSSRSTVQASRELDSHIFFQTLIAYRRAGFLPADPWAHSRSPLLALPCLWFGHPGCNTSTEY